MQTNKIIVNIFMGVAILITGFNYPDSEQPLPGGSQGPPSPLKILSNKVIWGKGLPFAIAHLEVLHEAEISNVELFSYEIVLPERFDEHQKDAIQSRSDFLTKKTENVEKTSWYGMIEKQFAFQKPGSKVATISLKESDSLAVAVVLETGYPIFDAHIKISTIKKELGAPERVGTRVLNARGEERPLILTLYSYAKGTIVFAEADIAPEPGLLNRVYINVPNLFNSLNKELR